MRSIALSKLVGGIELSHDSPTLQIFPYLLEDDHEVSLPFLPGLDVAQLRGAFELLPGRLHHGPRAFLLNLLVVRHHQDLLRVELGPVPSNPL